MSGFFNANVTSPFPDANMLFDPAKAQQTAQGIQANQLGLQARQLDLTTADHEQVGRLAAGLLNIQDPTARAQAYAQGVGVLQSQGLAKYAPPTLPDEGSLRMLVSQTVPAADQYKMGLGQNAALGAITALSPTGSASTTAAPGSTTGAAAPSSVPIPARGTGGPGASASAPAEWMPYFEEASKETGIPVDLLLAQARQESSFNPNNVGTSGEIGLFQIMPSTARSPGPGMQGVDPASITGPDNVRNNILFGARYLKSKMGGGDPNNPAVQAAALHAYNGLGVGGDPNYVQNVFRYRPTLAPSDPNAAVTAYTPPAAGATTASAAPAGGGGTSGSYQVASTAPVPPPGSTGAPGGPPAPPQFTYPNGKVGGPPDAQGGVHYADGNYDGSPGRGVPVAATTPAPTAPAQPGQPPTVASVQPTAQPAAVPQMTTTNGQTLPGPPQAPALLSNGLTPQQWGIIQGQLKLAGVSGPAAVQQVLAQIPTLQNANRAALQQAWQDAHPDLHFQTTGDGIVAIQPKTGQVMGVTPVHPVPTSPRPIQGTASWDGTQWVPATPGQPAVQGVWAYNNQGRGEFQPASGVPAQGAYENMKTAYNGDVSTIKDVSASGRSAQSSALQLNELADVIKNVQSGGALPEFRAKVAALMEANGAKPETIQAYTGMSSGSDAQVLQKLAVATIGASAKADLGSNVGVESLNLYANANPGMDKLQDANKRVTNMIRVAREQVDSYSLGAQQHFNQNQASMLHAPPGQVPDYHPLSEYNAQWQSQNNPQIGAAAIGILNGDGFDSWAARAAPAEAMNAVRLAARIDPNVKIPMPDGSFKTAQEVLSHGVGR